MNALRNSYFRDLEVHYSLSVNIFGDSVHDILFETQIVWQILCSTNFSIEKIAEDFKVGLKKTAAVNTLRHR